MAKVRSWVGLDVHARSVLAVTIDGESGELRSRRLSGTTSEVVEFCCSLPGPTRAAYEAGPTGYGLARGLDRAGVGCVVAAPGKIERPAADKVKTDQRDAERVLRLLMIDGLHPVRVPTGEEEALRDVVRAREAVRGDLMRARQRLGKLLLRHDVRCPDRAFTAGVLSFPPRSDGTMKKLINAPDAVVADALRGVEAAHGDRVRVTFDPYCVIRKDAPVSGKVGLVSGGGSGHEPMHGGFVGLGMLDAACPGEVFTSPTPDQMIAATKAVNGGAGVIHIVKNYTGDVMNFDMAAEMGKGEDIEVETILTNDDVAVEDSLYTAGRRGVGVTVLVEKICGGAAEDRRNLQEVGELGRRVNAAGRSMGMALTPCITPASGEPSFELGEDEVEIGIGIHGEPGRFREKIGPASQVAERLMTPILEDLPFSSGDRVLAFVNGMGGTPLVELYIVYAEVAKIASEHGLTIERNLIGNYITSLEMQGCSITLLKLDDEMVRYWDAPVNTPALRWGA